jgi:hippurate hydrolase
MQIGEDFMSKWLLAAAAAAVLSGPSLAQSGPAEAIGADFDAYLEGLYEHFHANPELSFEETETAERLAEELRQAGFEVTTGVGRTGLVGVMENGDGPVVALRADMDALPVREQTGLEFASTVTATNPIGYEVPVMHACAHDAHMTSLVGAARWMSENRDQWSGTLLLYGQPAEEIGEGAVAMIEDGLYERFPQPDAVIGQHAVGWVPPGEVHYRPGFQMANVDSVDIYVKGVGAHGSAPHRGVDPVVLASQIVVNLQTLVSREISPFDTGVVTVGAFNAGTKHNIIGDEAHLQITVRSYTDAVRATLLDGIARIARAQAIAADLPDELMPDVQVQEVYTPALYNDDALAEQAGGALRSIFGEDVKLAQPSTGGEDFSRFGMTEADIPIFYFWVGAQPEDKWAEYQAQGELPPSNHSPFFAPDAETAVVRGAAGMAGVALELFANGVAE